MKNAHHDLQEEFTIKMKVEEREGPEYVVGNIPKSSQRSKKEIARILRTHNEAPELNKTEQIDHIRKRITDLLGIIAQEMNTVIIKQQELEDIYKTAKKEKKPRGIELYIDDIKEINKELIDDYKRYLKLSEHIQEELSRKEIFKTKRELEGIQEKTKGNRAAACSYVRKFTPDKE